jgi:antitoxin MazE
MHLEVAAVKTRIVRIGSSQGVLIPKPLLEQTGLWGEVEITAEDGAVVIRSAKMPREGWAAALREMARRGDDALLDDVGPSLSSWDEDEWEWR